MTKKIKFEEKAEKWADKMYPCDGQAQRYLFMGAKFGYNEKCKELEEANKANEWHYVKDGDLPKDDKQYLVLFFYNYKGKKEMSFGVRDNLHSDFEIHRCYTEMIIAWKEIVLPELKESE